MMLQAEMDLLVIEAQMGNKKAFACLVEYFYPKLVAFARRLTSNASVAEDVVQETWITVSRQINTLNDPRAFKSWLFRAVRWRVIDIARTNGDAKRSIDLQDNEVETQNALENTTEQINQTELERCQLRRAIMELKEIDRSVIHLFYLLEMSTEQVAAVLEIPKGTVKSRLSRARKQLELLLNPSED